MRIIVIICVKIVFHYGYNKHEVEVLSSDGDGMGDRGFVFLIIGFFPVCNS